MKKLKIKYQDDITSVGRGFSRIQDNDSKYGNYITGEVITPECIVSIYSQGDKDSFAHTRLDIVKNGRLIMRSINKRYSKRGLVTLAKKFAKEIYD